MEADRVSREGRFNLRRDWRGNAATPGARYVTDGHLLFRKSAVKRGLERLARPNPKRKANSTIRCEKALAQAMRGARYGKHVLTKDGPPIGDWVPHTLWMQGVLRSVLVNARLHALAEFYLDFDAIRVPKRKTAPIQYLRRGKLVGALMPLRYEP